MNMRKPQTLKASMMGKMPRGAGLRPGHGGDRPTRIRRVPGSGGAADMRNGPPRHVPARTMPDNGPRAAPREWTLPRRLNLEENCHA